MSTILSCVGVLTVWCAQNTAADCLRNLAFYDEVKKHVASHLSVPARFVTHSSVCLDASGLRVLDRVYKFLVMYDISSSERTSLSAHRHCLLIVTVLSLMQTFDQFGMLSQIDCHQC